MTNFLQSYSGVLVAVFAQQIGLPVPSVVFLMAAGALSADGKMSPATVVSLGVLGCVAGDGVWYWVGRRWGAKATRLLCRFTPDPQSYAKKAQERFRRYGLPVLCFAKFVPGLDAIMPPLSGVEGVPLARFLVLDAVGSLLWSSCYVGLGYLLSNQLDVAIAWVQHCGTALGVAIGIPIVLYAAWRGLVLVRMVLELRQRRITPQMLAGKLNSDSKVAILDLMSFEEENDHTTLEAIPGAFVLDPALLRKSRFIEIPDDVKIVLYCSSGSDTVAARAGVGLRRIGVDKAWVLEGGLKAWRAHGLPVSRSPEVPEVVAERLGVKLPGITDKDGNGA